MLDRCMSEDGVTKTKAKTKFLDEVIKYIFILYFMYLWIMMFLGRVSKSQLAGALWQKSSISNQEDTAKLYHLIFDLPAKNADDCESKRFPFFY